MTIVTREQVIYTLGWIKGVVDMGLTIDDMAIKDDVAEAIEDILLYLEKEGEK